MNYKPLFLLFLLILLSSLMPSLSKVSGDYISQFIRVQDSSGTTLGSAHTFKGAASCANGVATFVGGGSSTGEIIISEKFYEDTATNEIYLDGSLETVCINLFGTHRKSFDLTNATTEVIWITYVDATQNSTTDFLEAFWSAQGTFVTRNTSELYWTTQNPISGLRFEIDKTFMTKEMRVTCQFNDSDFSDSGIGCFGVSTSYNSYTYSTDTRGSIGNEGSTAITSGYNNASNTHVTANVGNVSNGLNYLAIRYKNYDSVNGTYDVDFYVKNSAIDFTSDIPGHSYTGAKISGTIYFSVTGLTGYNGINVIQNLKIEYEE